jgi:bisphosphoglycerate-dependent phosphoglycerate mutase
MTTTFYGTSNNRIICLINQILEKVNLDIPSGWVIDNGSTFKIEGFGQTSRVTMIHPEEVSNPSRFVSKETFNTKFNCELGIPMPMGNVVYVVRHGHAGHNEPSATLSEAHDAPLTLLGIDQAKKSGQAILKDSDGMLPNLKLKSSDLFRTMETIEIILNELPEDQRTYTCQVCIEARENSRPFGGDHHWRRDDPLTEISIDPTISLEQLRLLAPGKTDLQLERMRIENCPRNDPIKKSDDCLRKINKLSIDWSLYEEKLTKGYAAGKTFGQIASEKTLFELIYEI